jgi:protein-tyrosine phosphatase
MIDWHSHILPGVDDGPADIEQSVVLAAALAAGGFSEVYCTPHLVRGCHEAGNDEVRWGVERLQERLDADGIPITLRTGREYYLDEYLQAALDDPLPLGDSRLLLVEIPPHATADMVRRLLYDVVRVGFTPVIAHPERSPLLEPPGPPAGNGGLRGALGHLLGGGHRNGPANTSPETAANPLLTYLRDLGCSFQGNLGSFSGFYGGHVKRTAESMRAAGLYDRYGTDVHTLEQAKMVLPNQQKQTVG